MRNCISCEHLGEFVSSLRGREWYSSGWCTKWQVYIPEAYAKTENYSDEWDCFNRAALQKLSYYRVRLICDNCMQQTRVSIPMGTKVGDDRGFSSTCKHCGCNGLGRLREAI